MSFWDGRQWLPTTPPTRPPRRGSRTRDWAATAGMLIVLGALILPLTGALATGPEVSTNPATSHTGATIVVTGTSFAARATIQLTWDDAPGDLPTAVVSGRGIFKVRMTVPEGELGPHTISVVDWITTGGGRATKAGQLGAVLASSVFTLATAVSASAAPSPTATPVPEPIPTPIESAAPSVAPSVAPTVVPTVAPTIAPTPDPDPSPSAAPTATPVPTATAAPSATAPPPTNASGFVVRCGISLCLDGRAYRFTGLNIYNANSRNNCWYTLGSGGGLDSSLSEIGTGQEAFRAWFFQRLAITNGVRDWSAFDHTLAVAAAHGQRIVVTLTNQWGDCENVTGSPVYKYESWYQSGYRSSVDAGMTTTYREFVREVVTRYRDNPTILAWQMINEGEARTAGTWSCSSTAKANVHNWAVDISALIKSLDSNHLVSLGTIGSGQCGTSTGTAYEDLHALPTIDLCEYHDYDSPTALMPGDQWNGLATRLSQCHARGKPMFIGEVGIKTNDVMTPSMRAAYMNAKWSKQFETGIVGVLPWEWATGGQNSGDGYSIGPNDPILALLSAY